MKTLSVAAVGALLSIAVAGQALAASPVGEWKTPKRNGVVAIYECDGALCGKLLNGDDIRANPNITDQRNHDVALRSRPLKGLPLFYGVRGGPSEWKGGSVYNPEDGKTYHGSITMVDDNTLKLTGCVIYPFCETQVWHRAN